MAAVQKRAFDLMPLGSPDYVELFKTPVFNRVPALVEGLGYPIVHFLVCQLIYDVRACIHVRYPMTNQQVMATAGMIILKCQNEHLGLDDLVVFFEQIKQGRYELYNKLDQPTLANALEKYRTDRIEAFDHHQQDLKTLGWDARSQQKPLELNEQTGHYEHKEDWTDKMMKVQGQLKYLTNKLKDNEQ